MGQVHRERCEAFASIAAAAAAQANAIRALMDRQAVERAERHAALLTGLDALQASIPTAGAR